MRKTPITSAQYYLQVTPQEESILKLLSETNQPLTRQEIADGIQIKSSTNLSKSLQEMRRAGYINRDYRGIQVVWSLNPDHFAAVLINPPPETIQA